MKIVFLGTSYFSIACLKALLDSKHEVLAVVCQPDKPSGRGNKLTAPPIKTFAEENGLKVYQFNKIRVDGVETLKSLKPDALVVAAYGQILSQEILDIALPINVHGSLLPKYRGASPIQTALINGDAETGITIMKMAFEVDSGDIILQEKLKIEPTDNAETLFEKMGVLGGKLLVKALDLIEEGKATFTPQDNSQATFTKMLTKEGAEIDFNDTSENIVNKVRGYYKNPTAYFIHNGEKIKVFSAESRKNLTKLLNGHIISANSKEGLIIKCLNGAVEIVELQAPNGKRMAAKAYLNGKKFE